MDKLFTADSCASLQSSFDITWLVHGACSTEIAAAFEHTCRPQSKVQVVSDDGNVKVDDSCHSYYVARDVVWLMAAVDVDWAKVDVGNQVVFVSNGVGGNERDVHFNRAYAESGLKVRGKIFSLVQLEGKLKALEILRQKPEMWGSGELVRIAYTFQPKKTKKLIKILQFSIDRPQFFYSVLDPYNEVEYDFDMVIFKLSDSLAAEKLIEAKQRLQKDGKRIHFSNPPEMFDSFRKRDLNVDLMNKVFDSKEFKDQIIEYGKINPGLQNKEILVPKTIILSPVDITPEVIYYLIR